MGGLYFLYCAHRTNGSDRCWVGWLWRLIDWLHHTLGRTLVNGAITDHTLHIVGAITYITYRCVPHINGTMTERSVQSHIYHISYVVHIVSHIICDTYRITYHMWYISYHIQDWLKCWNAGTTFRAEQELYKQIWRAIESKRESDRTRGSRYRYRYVTLWMVNRVEISIEHLTILINHNFTFWVWHLLKEGTFNSKN